MPDSLGDSAAVGSTATRVEPVSITNEGDGELRWAARVKHAAPWLTLQPDTGIVGVSAPPQALADPTGLALGVYRDTIIVADRSSAASFLMPVVFRIHP